MFYILFKKAKLSFRFHKSASCFTEKLTSRNTSPVVPPEDKFSGKQRSNENQNMLELLRQMNGSVTDICRIVPMLMVNERPCFLPWRIPTSLIVYVNAISKMISCLEVG